MDKLKNIKYLKLKIFTLVVVLLLLVTQIGPFMVYADNSQLAFTWAWVDAPCTNQYYDGINLNFTKTTLGGEISYCLDHGLNVPGTSRLNYLRDASPVLTSAIMHGYPRVSAAGLGVNSNNEAQFATQLAVWSLCKSTRPNTDSQKSNMWVDLDQLKARPGREAEMARVIAAAKRIQSAALNSPNYVNPKTYIDSTKISLIAKDGYLTAGPYKVVATGFNVSSVNVTLENQPATARIIGTDGYEKKSFANGDTFYVRFKDTEEGSQLKINIRSTGSTVSGRIYGTGNADGRQDFVRLFDDPVELTDSLNLKWPTLTGSIQINKKDQFGSIVAGATFELRNEAGTVVDKKTTGADGVVKFENIKIGKYKIYEVSAPKEYVLAIDPIDLTLNPKQNITINFNNRKIVGGLKIIKVDEDNKALAGVKFQILDASKKVIEEITTNSEGIAATSQLTPGTYYYKEVSAPSHVIIDSTERLFTISNENKTVEVKVENKLVKGKLTIEKFDEYSKPLAGVKFQILDANKKVVDTVTTNSAGIAVTKELKGGTYYYKEISVPDGIVLDSSEIKFTMEYANKTIKVTNNHIKGKLKIRKVDENKVKLEGITFEIYDVNKNLVDTIVTNKEGEAISKDLVKGTYYYKETKGPDKVIIDTGMKKFEIKENNEVVIRDIENKLSRGTLRIIKVDENEEPLQGIKFEIYNADKKLIDTIVTNKKGIAESKDLVLGTYYYKEVEGPANIIINTEMVEFKVEKNEQIVIQNVVNKFARGKLEITKTDENATPVAGVKFEILNSKKKVIETIVTDKDGKATSSELLLGKYYFREAEVPDSIIIDTNLYDFELTKNNEVIQKSVVNKLSRGTLKIIKVDENENPIEGIKFEIYDSNKKLIDTIVTDKKGIAESKELVLGTYYYKEVEGPATVIINTEMVEFKVEKNEQIVIQNVVNKLSRGTLEILKTDDTGKPLAGVEFEILDHKKKRVETIVTDENGKAVSSNLLLGTYYYKETKVPDNVVIDKKLYEFELTKNEQVITKNIINNRIQGGLVIIKKDKDTKEPLQGVIFQILNENREVIDTIITDQEGKATIGGLLKGKYYYKEVETIEDYIINTTEYEFNIENNLEVIEKTVYNEHIKLPVTGGFIGTDTLIIIIVAVAVVAGYAIFMVVQKNKKAKEQNMNSTENKSDEDKQ